MLLQNFTSAVLFNQRLHFIAAALVTWCTVSDTHLLWFKLRPLYLFLAKLAESVLGLDAKCGRRWWRWGCKR